jgi:ketol-acid reductoisomerase
MFSDDDADLAVVAQRNVAVLGFGGLAQAHALSLRDSGVDVRIGLPKSSPARTAADAEGLRVLTAYEACEEADLVALLAPGVAQRAVFAAAVEPNLVEGDAVLVGDGFDVHFGLVRPPEGVDVFLVAAQAPAPVVRREFVEGRGVPVLVAVEQDASGAGWDLALSYAKAIGGTRAGALRTTFAEVAQTALFAQLVVGGGVQALVRVGYEALLEAGYQPDVAYLQCSAELRDAVGRGADVGQLPGVAVYARSLGGPALVDAAVKGCMRELLADVTSGEFARRFVADQDAGAPHAARLAAGHREHPSVRAGADVAALLGWDPRPAGHDDDGDVLADDLDDPRSWLS